MLDVSAWSLFVEELSDPLDIGKRINGHIPQLGINTAAA